MLRITSAQNARFRDASRLIESSRDRRKTGKCVLEGEHLIAVYAERVGMPESVIVSEDALRRPAIEALVRRIEPAVVVVPVMLFARLASLPAGVGMIAVVPTPRPEPEGPGDFCVLLEDVQDPGNVGSILRTAAAAGADRLVLSRGCAFAWAPKVLRAGQGAHFLLAIDEGVNLAAWCARFARTEGRVIATLARGGASLYDTPLTGRVAMVFGNEGAGISAELQRHVSTAVTIPMPGGMESVNAAAAAAICVFERVRQAAKDV